MENFLKKINWNAVLLALLSIVIISFILSTSCQKQNNDKLKNNIKAMNDTIQTLRLSNGDLLSEKQSFLLNIKELNDYIDISDKERKELERKLNSSLANIAKMKGEIHTDTLLCHDSVFISVKDSSLNIMFNYKDDWLSLDGSTKYNYMESITKINKIDIPVPLTVGWTDDMKVFVKTENPYITFSSIDAAVIEDSKAMRKKRFNVGFQVSAMSVQYDLIHKTVGVGPSLGVGLSFGFDF